LRSRPGVVEPGLAVADPGSRSSTATDKEDPMSDEIRNKDDAKGRLKEAAGSLSGDEDLKREGKVDKAAGAAKDGVEKVTDKIKDAIRRD
jgi:uncharacterized protein YjbJ (UPF0337 family)